MSQWYAIRSATRRELAARTNLEEAGVTVFLPMEARWGHRPGQIGRVRVERPLIRGYLFVLIDLAQDEERVLGVEGVHNFLGYTDERGDIRPLRIPLHFIIELQVDESAGRYDHTLYVKPKYQPKKGDKVKATAGPWLGWFGKVIATPRGQRAHVQFEGPHGRGAIVQVGHLTPAA